MKTKLSLISGIILGLILGIFITGIFLSISVDNMMVKEIDSPYDFDKTVDVLSKRINTKSPWHVTEIIDQNEEIVNGGGQAIGKMKIIKYCHGPYSSKMLIADERKMMGNMMPKSFAVYEKSDGRVYISTMNGAVMGKIFGGEIEKIIEDVGLEVEDILRFVNFRFSIF
jgi:uncharacterized protein (DUF302 family)